MGGAWEWPGGGINGSLGQGAWGKEPGAGAWTGNPAFLDALDESFPEDPGSAAQAAKPLREEAPERGPSTSGSAGGTPHDDLWQRLGLETVQVVKECEGRRSPARIMDDRISQGLSFVQAKG